MRFLSWAVLGKRIKAIGPLLKDKAVPLWKKALVCFGVFYLLMPIDLIPAPVFLVSWVDDLILWVFILHTLKEELDRYGQSEKEVDLNEKFHGKNIVDDVEFKVEENFADAEAPEETTKQ